jgi:hypothetical protein
MEPKYLARAKQELATTIRQGIREEVCLLSQSERGRDVRADLLTFLNSRVSGLDGRGWEAVIRLIVSYQSGYAGSVLETLENGGTSL